MESIAELFGEDVSFRDTPTPDNAPAPEPRNLYNYILYDYIEKYYPSCITPVAHMGNNMWVCTTRCYYSEGLYNDIARRNYDDIYEEEKNKPIEFMAAVKLENGWFRACALPNGTWGLIDEGKIVNNVLCAIQLPRDSICVPFFSCCVQFTLESFIKPFERIKATLHMKLGDTISIHIGNNILAVASVWQPWNSYSLLAPIDERELHITQKQLLKNGDKVVMVRYSSASSFTMRFGDPDKRWEYYQVRFEIQCAMLEATPIETIPRLSDIVLCKFDYDGKTHRTYICGILEDGKFEGISLETGYRSYFAVEDMYNCTEELKNSWLITNTQLMGVVHDPPTTDVRNYVDWLIRDEIVLSCHFDPENWHNGVVLFSTNPPVGMPVNDVIQLLMIHPLQWLSIQHYYFPVNHVFPKRFTVALDAVDLSSPGPHLLITNFAFGEWHLYCMLYNDDIMGKLHLLTYQLGMYIKKNKSLPFTNPKIGSLCITLYDRSVHEREYCRGRVLDIKNDLVTLKLIDYGMKTTVLLSSIKKLPPRFLPLPPLAKRCLLDLHESVNKPTIKKIKNFLVKKNPINISSIRISPKDGTTYFISVPEVFEFMKTI